MQRASAYDREGRTLLLGWSGSSEFTLERRTRDNGLLWARRFIVTPIGGEMDEDIEMAVRPHLALSPEGEAWVYGSFWGTQQFGTFTLTASQGADNVLLRLAP